MTFLRRFTLAAAASSILAMPATLCFAGQAKPIHYFISVDGLQGDLLRTLDAKQRLTGTHGFHWLLEDGLVADKAWPVVTTLTAASHVSTITCSPPSRHGIFANNFIAAGKSRSGFDEPFASEPLWRAAMRQGKKVLSLAYVGTTGDRPERTADYAVGYPVDSLLGPSQTLDLEIAALPLAQGWTLPDNLPHGADLRETTLTLTLNPKTKESRLIQVLVDVSLPAAPRYWLGTDKDLATSLLGTLDSGTQPRRWLDLFFTEKDPASTLPGVKRHSFVYPLPAVPGRLALYVSKASYNAAYPASFRQRLDDLNLVWPDYGVRSDKITLSEYVETQSMIDRFLADVGTKFAPDLGVDLVLFYQPLIDSLGHKEQAALPQPFEPAGGDEVTQAFVRAFQIVDQDLAKLLAAADDRSVVELMGDHGMDAVHSAVNLAQLLPKDHIGKLQVVNSGSLTLLYAPQNVPASAEATATVNALAEELKTKLMALHGDDGRPVFESAVKKSDFTTDRADDYAKEWQYGEALWAVFSAKGYWFLYDPLNPAVFFPPSALGMHGTALTVPTMATTLVVRGPGVQAGHVAETSLINAVPTFSRLTGLEVPRDCLGQSLVR